ncbi:LysR family transcriptional regulator ArgP [Crenobacter sp. SG2303]|uniref:LysR family transcriptional regulator ArgP n=1 Tax=Crenobacter oryzisoli TaxID=3056844 RepID=A0ABT7XUB8_9NEIS|nr:LysR family transcriptional regulator ArgP [Crenobacter sp. SG2303]MDN0077330.1 LysR family transcriptional regulator ArgP [Crenobacter sp. SG2303]
MFDPRHLQALSAVVDSGGFDKAASQLFITQSAVSQRIRQLEDRIGQLVLTRTTPVQPTTVGRRLLQHYRQLSLMEADLMDALQPDNDANQYTTLAVGVNNDSLASWFLPAIAPLLAERRLLLDVMLDDQDYTHELMRQGHVIGCVSTRAQPIQGGDSVPLGVMRYRCLATPAFAIRHFPGGLSHEALAKAPAIEFSHKDDLHSEYLADKLGYRGSYPRFLLPNPASFIDGTRLGFAYSLLPELMLGDELAKGELIDLTPGQWVDLPLYWHHWRVGSALVEDLADTLLAYCRQALRPIPDRS